jgi:hypothetical protein
MDIPAEAPPAGKRWRGHWRIEMRDRWTGEYNNPVFRFFKYSPHYSLKRCLHLNRFLRVRCRVGHRHRRPWHSVFSSQHSTGLFCPPPIFLVACGWPTAVPPCSRPKATTGQAGRSIRWSRLDSASGPLGSEVHRRHSCSECWSRPFPGAQRCH